MNLTLFVFSASIGVIGFVLFVLFGHLSWKGSKLTIRRYDVLIDFPFELYQSKTFADWVSRISFGVFELSFVLMGTSLLGWDVLLGLRGYLFFCLIVLFAKAVFYNLLLYVPASQSKIHTAIALSSFLFDALCCFVSGLFFFQFNNIDQPVIGWTMSLVLWVFSFAFLGLSINPKLMRWEKMKVVEDMDGSHLEKPRPFVLAFSEWIAIFFDIALFVAYFIAFLLLYFLV